MYTIVGRGFIRDQQNFQLMWKKYKKIRKNFIQIPKNLMKAFIFEKPEK